MDENLSRGYVQLGRRKTRLRTSRPTDDGRPCYANNPPRDPCNCIYIGLLLAGVGFLLPYNSFVSAVDYYQWMFPKSFVVFDMSLVYILVAFLAVILNNLFIESLSLHIRITFGYIISFFTLLFVTVTIICFDLFDPSVAYRINLMAVAVVAFGCTVQQSSFYGYTSMLPPRYTAAVMTGESAAGLLISLNRIVTKAVFDNVKINTLIFFFISISIVLLCVIIHFLVRRTRFVVYYLNMASKADQEQDGDEQKKITLEPTEDLGLVDILEAVESRNSYGVLKLQSPTGDVTAVNDSTIQEVDKKVATAVNFTSDYQNQTITSEEYANNWSNSTAEAAANNSKTTFKVEDVVLRMRGTSYNSGIRLWTGIKRGALARYHVAKTVWPYMLAIGVNYFITMCLFPGIESEVVSCRWHSWMPVLLIATFNTSDFIGKVIAAIPHEYTGLQLVLLSFSRFILMPMLIMCVAPINHPVIQVEGWAIFFSLLFGLTNGVFGSVPMIMAPSKVLEEHRELTGNIMTLSYSLGLTSGSGMAYLLGLMMGPPPMESASCAKTTNDNYTQTSIYNNFTQI